MKLKENDTIPNSKFFIMEDGNPVKKNIQEFFKNKINLDGNNVVLATAHPCKFPNAIDQSIGIKPSLPEKLKYIMDEKENYDIIPNNLKAIKKHIKEKI